MAHVSSRSSANGLAIAKPSLMNMDDTPWWNANLLIFPSTRKRGAAISHCTIDDVVEYEMRVATATLIWACSCSVYVSETGSKVKEVAPQEGSNPFMSTTSDSVTLSHKNRLL